MGAVAQEKPKRVEVRPKITIEKCYIHLHRHFSAQNYLMFHPKTEATK